MRNWCNGHIYEKLRDKEDALHFLEHLYSCVNCYTSIEVRITFSATAELTASGSCNNEFTV